MVLFFLVMLVFEGGVVLNWAPWYKDSWWLRQCFSFSSIYFPYRRVAVLYLFQVHWTLTEGVAHGFPGWWNVSQFALSHTGIKMHCRVPWVPLFSHVLVSFSSLCIALAIYSDAWWKLYLVKQHWQSNPSENPPILIGNTENTSTYGGFLLETCNPYHLLTVPSTHSWGLQRRKSAWLTGP